MKPLMLNFKNERQTQTQIQLVFGITDIYAVTDGAWGIRRDGNGLSRERTIYLKLYQNKNLLMWFYVNQASSFFSGKSKFTVLNAATIVFLLSEW